MCVEHLNLCLEKGDGSPQRKHFLHLLLSALAKTAKHPLETVINFMLGNLKCPIGTKQNTSLVYFPQISNSIEGFLQVFIFLNFAF